MILKFILIILIIILGLCQFLFNKYVYNQSINKKALEQFFALHFFPFALIPRSIAQIIAYFTLFCWCLWSLHRDLYLGYSWDYSWDFFHSYTTFSILTTIMFFHAFSLLYIHGSKWFDDK